jgi:cytochrome c553
MTTVRLKTLLLCAMMAAAAVLAVQTPPAPAAQNTEAPAYDAVGNALLPKNYREWVWLSSGLGMTYNEPAGGDAAAPRRQNFTNVFVNPSSYRAFLQTGTWPDKTVLVLEIRGSESQGSINKGGNYQGAVRAIELEVKDEKKFPGKWAFFSVKTGADRGTQFPQSADCYTCHAQHGAVDNTFVQFYPTLAEAAKAKGTLREMPAK